jgi:hypothetical protein
MSGSTSRRRSRHSNSDGGLIVWGLDARRDATTGVDCAQGATPIEDSALFMSGLNDHGGRATSPIVDGVQHRIVAGENGPFAATLVPASYGGPHMAKHGEDRY